MLRCLKSPKIRFRLNAPLRFGPALARYGSFLFCKTSVEKKQQPSSTQKKKNLSLSLGKDDKYFKYY